MTFKKERFLALLKERQACFDKTQSRKAFRKSDKSKNLELLHFFTLLADYSFWLSKNDYVRIINNFVHNQITFDEFTEQFDELTFLNFQSHTQLERDLEKVVSTSFDADEINIDYNPKSEGFAKLIDKIESVIDLCDPKVDEGMSPRLPKEIGLTMNEDSLKSQLEFYFLQEIESY